MGFPSDTIQTSMHGILMLHSSIFIGINNTSKKSCCSNLRVSKEQIAYLLTEMKNT